MKIVALAAAALMLAGAAKAQTPSIAKNPAGGISANQKGQPMKILVVYYSRTGNTKKVCQELAARLGADCEEIIATKSRSGIWGYLMGGRDAAKNTPAVIKPVKYDPGQYDLVVIGTPVWVGTMPPAIRTYIAGNNDKLKNVAYLCTMGGRGGDKTILAMEEQSGKKGTASLILLTKEIQKDQYSEKLNQFAAQLKQ